jgi:DNA-binding XRE family transcriptional regulator
MRPGWCHSLRAPGFNSARRSPEPAGNLDRVESAQIRAARALLGWRQEDLSRASGVGTATIQRIEKSHRPITGYVSTLVRIQAAFEQAGIQFIADDETGGVGLRMAKKTRKR